MQVATQPLSVYLVDDSAEVCQRLIEMLRTQAGVTTVGVANTADDAIQGILKTRPDCVLLDLRLGDSNGIDVLQAIHAAAPAIVFIVLTNHVDGQYRRRCLEAGANFFFDKSHELSRVKDVLAWLAQQARVE